MILFKPEHVKPILEGRKTQTRRVGNKRWNVGAIHQARTRMMDASSCFARLEIGDVVYESLHQVSPYAAWNEGYDSVAEFIDVWERIHGAGTWAADPGVWVVSFRIVGG